MLLSSLPQKIQTKQWIMLITMNLLYVNITSQYIPVSRGFNKRKRVQFSRSAKSADCITHHLHMEIL